MNEVTISTKEYIELLEFKETALMLAHEEDTECDFSVQITELGVKLNTLRTSLTKQ